ncbi:hypothetical protein CLU79DRAFT_885167 [Phycomyces nitens]|nr:hypothetical protein CLU79DRAFT_885167 [Phycomyces nitens]
MKALNNIASTLNSPIPTNLEGECKKAAKILNSFIDPGQGLDKVIPTNIIENAQGLAIYTVIKAGFLFSGRAGSGLVVARLPDGGWSAPSAIGTGGMGAGGQIGAELTDFVLVLNTKEAVKTFSQFGNVTLGGNVSVAAGPIGRNAEASGSASFKHIAAIFSYSKTKGLFAGVSIEGSVVVTRGDANEKFYGKRVTAKELLSGKIPPPPEADVLYRALNARFHSLGSTGALYNRGDNQSFTFTTSSISGPGQLRQPLSNQPNTGRYGAPPPPPPTQKYGAPPTPSAPTSYNQSQTTTPPGNYSAPPPSYSQYPQPPGGLSAPTGAKRPPPPPPVSRKPREETAKAMYDFAGEQPGDLSFKTGDIITIVEKSDSQEDWWTGRIGTRQGVFPANFVTLQ